MAIVRFNCSACGIEIEADGEFGGNVAQCPSCNNSVLVPMPGISEGMEVGGFLIEKRLGVGGMGEVWLANQTAMDRKVALKILSPALTKDSEFVDRFMEEIKTSAKLEHPNIVSAHYAGHENGVYFLAMTYVDGVELDDKLTVDKQIDEKEALRVVRGIAEALQYAWDEFKLIHRDIKPSNIMIDAKNRPRLMDMGISKSLSEDKNLTMTGVVIGTPYYMSPEQARAEEELDSRSDAYALGSTLYHMVTGEVPYDAATTMGILTKHITDPFPPPQDKNPKVSDECSVLLEIMMAKKAKDRHNGWAEVIADIDRVLNGQFPKATRPEIGASQVMQSTSSRLLKRRKVAKKPPKAKMTALVKQEASESKLKGVNKPLIGAVAAVALICIIGVAAFLSRGSGKSSSSMLPHKAGSKMANEKDVSDANANPSRTDVANAVKKKGRQDATIPKTPEELHKALKALNPDYNRKGKFTIEDGGITAVELQFCPSVSNINCLKGMPLKEVILTKTKVTDCSLLKGMKLEKIALPGGVRDISFLKDMPVAELYLMGSNTIKDFSQLEGMKLRYFSLMDNKNISDIGFLKGMKLCYLALSGTKKISDFSVIKEMPLRELYLSKTQFKDMNLLEGMKLQIFGARNAQINDISILSTMPLKKLMIEFCEKLHDLTPLKNCETLENLRFTPKYFNKASIDTLRQMKSLKLISTDVTESGKKQSATEFWKKYDAGEYGKPVNVAKKASVKKKTEKNADKDRLLGMWEFAVDYAAKNPNEFDRIIANFSKIQKSATGTKYEMMADVELDKVKKRKEAQRKASELAEKKNAELLENLASLIFKRKCRAAYKKITEEDAKSFPDLKNAIKDLVNVNKIIAKSFEKDIGTSVNVETQKGPQVIKIKRIKGKTLYIEKLMGKASVQTKFSLKTLTDAERQKRLSKMDPVAKALCLGIAAVRKKQLTTAEKYFKQAGKLSEPMLKQLAATQPRKSDAPNKPEKLETPKSSNDIASGIEKIDFNKPWTTKNGQIELLPIKAGAFMMGDNSKQRKITISKPFWMGKYEVTQDQFESVAGFNPSCWLSPGKKAPAESLCWYDAMDFCETLNEKERKNLPKGYVYRLPTEAEWEYCYRAGTKTRYFFGDDTAKLHEYGNYCDKSYIPSIPNSYQDHNHDDAHGLTAPVGSYKANTWGLHDMCGNVMEWCLDWAGEDSGESESDPTGATEGVKRIARGGDYSRQSTYCCAFISHPLNPEICIYGFGLRIVLAPKIKRFAPAPKTAAFKGSVKTPNDLQQALKALNPGYAGKGKFKLDGNKIVGVEIIDNMLKDISSLKGLPLQRINISKTRVIDISPLKGMKLKNASLPRTVIDISVFNGMPINSLCFFNGSRVKDFSPLKKMDLSTLALSSAFQLSDINFLKGKKLRYLNLMCSRNITDLGVIKGMPLKELYLSQLFNFKEIDLLKGMKLINFSADYTAIDSVSVLAKMPLKKLSLENCMNLKDLTPLKSIKTLESLRFTPKFVTPESISTIRNMKSLKKINNLPPDEFWKKYDDGAYK